MPDEKVTFHAETKVHNGATWLVSRHEGYGDVVVLKSDNSDCGFSFYLMPEDAAEIGRHLLFASRQQEFGKPGGSYEIGSGGDIPPSL